LFRKPSASALPEQFKKAETAYMPIFRSSSEIKASALNLFGGQLSKQAIMLILPFGVQQMIRLATNILLARMLAPEMFGIMLLINTLRTGTELLSDIGIGQSVVRSTRGTDRAFLDTAWTIQLCRGVVLMLVMLVLAIPLGSFYDHPQLSLILVLVSSTFLFIGLQSPEIFLIQRDMRLKQRAVYDLSSTAVQCSMTIALAYFFPSVWALVWGLILSTLFTTVMSYMFAPFRLPKLSWHKDHVSEILSFGKWIFLSTAIYFAAISTDKVYFSSVLPLALVGVYSVSRTFSDMLASLSQRVGAFLVFPKVASLKQNPEQFSKRFRQIRRTALIAVAAAMMLAISVSDALILLLYDDRYHAAAFMLPVLLIGVWFAILSIFAESTLTGLDRPQDGAAGNAVKFAVLAIGLPLAVLKSGLFAALLILALAEMVRWVSLSLALRRRNISAIRDDVILSVIIAVGAITIKYVLGAVHIVPSLSEWWNLRVLLHG
jgi:O-antigen/teichoic acid export membrane protein